MYVFKNFRVRQTRKTGLLENEWNATYLFMHKPSVNFPIYHQMKNMSKVALITGVTGQVGAYLSEFAFRKGYHRSWDQKKVFACSTQTSMNHLYRI